MQVNNPPRDLVSNLFTGFFFCAKVQPFSAFHIPASVPIFLSRIKIGTKRIPRHRGCLKKFRHPCYLSKPLSTKISAKKKLKVIQVKNQHFLKFKSTADIL